MTLNPGLCETFHFRFAALNMQNARNDNTNMILEDNRMVPKH